MLISKYLGVLTANILTWKHHIAYASGKIARGIRMIIKAFQYINKQRLISFYCFHLSLLHTLKPYLGFYLQKSSPK